MVIELRDKKEYFTKLYNLKKDANDLLGCITSLKSLEKSGFKDFFLYYEFSVTYLKMELYYQCLDSIFKAYTYCNNEQEYALFGLLGATYYKLSNDELAGYYIQKYIKSKSTYLDDYVHEIINEFIEEVTSVENNFYLAYPYDKADFSKLLEESEEVFSRGNYEEVIDMLKVIPQTSKYYVDALLKIAVCNFLLGNTEKAICDMKIAVIIEPDDVYALCNLISMLYDSEDKEGAKNYLKKLDELDVTDDDELYKVVMLYCELAKHKKAIFYGEKLLKLKPFDKNILHMLAIAYYNIGDFEKAYNYFKKVFILTGTFVSSTYLAVCENAIKYKTAREYKKLNYIYDVPKNTRKIITQKLNEIIKDKNYEITEENASEFFSLMDYCFESESYNMQASSLTLLSQISSMLVDNYLKNLLLKQGVYDRIKQGIVGHLLDADYIELLSVSVGGTFKKVKMHRPNFKNTDKNSVFFTAYVYAFAKLVFFEKDLKVLCQTCEDLYEKAKENGITILQKDAKELGAVIYELSNIRKVQKRKEFGKFFDVNLKKVKQLKLLFENE